MSESLFRKFAFGILILSNKINPLSIPSTPSFIPQSPRVIPGRAIWVFLSRRGTMKACGPWFSPLTINYAKSTQVFEVLAAPPIQNFMPSLHGVLIMNSLALWSYVAVVRIPFTFDPWPSSVKAKQLLSKPYSILSFQTWC